VKASMMAVLGLYATAVVLIAASPGATSTASFSSPMVVAAGAPRKVLTDAEIPKAVAAAMWNPVYLPIEAASTEPAGVAPSLATHS